MYFWLFWLNEAGLMMNLFKYGNRIELSNIWSHTQDSGNKLCVWKWRKWIFFQIWVFRGAIEKKIIKSKKEFLITCPEIQLLQINVYQD